MGGISKWFNRSQSSQPPPPDQSSSFLPTFSPPPPLPTSFNPLPTPTKRSRSTPFLSKSSLTRPRATSGAKSTPALYGNGGYSRDVTGNGTGFGLDGEGRKEEEVIITIERDPARRKQQLLAWRLKVYEEACDWGMIDTETHKVLRQHAFSPSTTLISAHPPRQQPISLTPSKSKHARNPSHQPQPQPQPSHPFSSNYTPSPSQPPSTPKHAHTRARAKSQSNVHAKYEREKEALGVEDTPPSVWRRKTAISSEKKKENERKRRSLKRELSFNNEETSPSGHNGSGQGGRLLSSFLAIPSQPSLIHLNSAGQPIPNAPPPPLPRTPSSLAPPANIHHLKRDKSSKSARSVASNSSSRGSNSGVGVGAGARAVGKTFWASSVETTPRGDGEDERKKGMFWSGAGPLTWGHTDQNKLNEAEGNEEDDLELLMKIKRRLLTDESTSLIMNKELGRTRAEMRIVCGKGGLGGILNGLEVEVGMLRMECRVLMGDEVLEGKYEGSFVDGLIMSGEENVGYLEMLQGNTPSPSVRDGENALVRGKGKNRDSMISQDTIKPLAEIHNPRQPAGLGIREGYPVTQTSTIQSSSSASRSVPSLSSPFLTPQQSRTNPAPGPHIRSISQASVRSNTSFLSEINKRTKTSMHKGLGRMGLEKRRSPQITAPMMPVSGIINRNASTPGKAKSVSSPAEFRSANTARARQNQEAERAIQALAKKEKLRLLEVALGKARHAKERWDMVMDIYTERVDLLVVKERGAVLKERLMK